MDIKPLNKWIPNLKKPLVIAGPCSAETEEQVLSIAREVAKIEDVRIFRAGIWKPQTRPNSFEGVGEEALSWMAKAKEEGLQGCYLKFRSTMEPWEDYLGSVRLTVCGYRKINAKEKAEQERTDAIEALAKEKDITFHEALTLTSLGERGKL